MREVNVLVCLVAVDGVDSSGSGGFDGVREVLICLVGVDSGGSGVCCGVSKCSSPVGFPS